MSRSIEKIQFILSDRALKTVPDKILQEICSIIESEEFSHENIDNFRACLVGDAVGEKEFQEMADSGCCGSFEKTIELDGLQYKVGFNYGH